MALALNVGTKRQNNTESIRAERFIRDAGTVVIGLSKIWRMGHAIEDMGVVVKGKAWNRRKAVRICQCILNLRYGMLHHA